MVTMGLIPTATLARLRAFHAARLPDTAEVLEDATQRGLEGGTQVTGTTTRSTYACRVSAQQTNPAEVPEGGRPVAQQFYDVLLPWDAVVKTTDRLRVNGRVFRVVDVKGGESERTVLNVVAIEVRG